MIKNTSRNRNGLGLEEVDLWPEEIDGVALLEELRQVMKRYVVLPPMAAEALALWTVHTYAFELRDVSTYIGLGSPQKRCGKTTVLSVLSELVNRAVVASNISPPALFRAIEEARPTLLIDEADTFLHGNEELRGILNSGYTRKTAYVVRVASETRDPERGRRNERNGSGLRRYSCWCPKVIAAIGKLPETLMDRCIPITMQRKTAREVCARVRHLSGFLLRRKCARWVEDHQDEIASARPEIPSALNDRAADIWEPLLVVGDIAGGEWPKLARDAAMKLSAGVQDSSVIGSLLLDILLVFVQLKIERAFSKSLAGWLNQKTDRPWMDGRKGKPIDEVWLAQQLRPYGVRPKTIWIEEQAARGYLQSDFEEVWPRYVSRTDLDAVLAEVRDREVPGVQAPSSKG